MQGRKRRMPTAEQLRKSGLSDAEINELLGEQEEVRLRKMAREQEIESTLEYGHLQQKAARGELDGEDREKLRKKIGLLFTFDFNGETILVNHCFIAKCVMCTFLFVIVAHIIYLTQSENATYQIQQKSDDADSL